MNREHIYRTHCLPIQCQRCWSSFKSDDDRDEHLRCEPVCAKKEMNPLKSIDNIDKKQKAELKDKKRSRNFRSEEEKWKDVWRILFPDYPDSAIPVPPCEIFLIRNDRITC